MKWKGGERREVSREGLPPECQRRGLIFARAAPQEQNTSHGLQG